MKRYFVFMVIVMMVLILIAAEPATAKYYTVAAPPASSSLYPYWVSVGKAVSTVYPEFQITVTESQGVADITRKIRAGAADWGNSMSNADYELFHGTGSYKDDQDKNVRVMWYWDKTPIQFVVTKDSGIKSVQELTGKRFNPGATGGGTAQGAMKVLDLLGIEYDIFEATQADAGEAVSNRQIVGTVKQGKAPDSFVMQIGATIAIDVLSFSDADIKKINEEYPYFVATTIPAGAYKWLDHEVKTFQVFAGAQALSTRLTQEEGYKIFKAMNEGGKSIWQAAYPLGANVDLIELTLNSNILLHAGTVQYLKEKGVNVPAELIPPEYK